MKSHLLLYTSSISFILTSIVFTISRFLFPTDKQCLKLLFPYSPAFEAVQYSWINFAEFYYPHSPLRGNSNEKPDLEETWRNYTYDGVISVPYDRLQDLNISPEQDLWPVTPIEGGGVAAVLGIHFQTNCLNLIRKYIHRDTYNYTDEPLFNPYTTYPETLRAQVDQCLEVLRQELVCHVDQSLYLIWKDPAQISGWNEDNAVRHKCRNYDGIKEWAEDHRIRNLHDPLVYFPRVILDN